MPLARIIKVAALMCTEAISFAQAMRGSLTSTVHVIATDTYGKDYGSPIAVDSFIDDNGKDWVRSFKEGVGSELPFGSYTMEAWRHGKTSRVHLWLSSKETWITAAFETDTLDSDRLFVDAFGHLRGLPSERGRSCVLSGVFVDARYGVSLGEDGSFNFGDVIPGLYFMACFKAPEILYQDIVHIEGGEGPIDLVVKRPH